MKPLTRKLLALGMPLVFTACATMGPPQPPSLDLPKAPSDLRATRKGDRVTLIWTIPSVTTDRQAVTSFGATRICRGLEPSLTRCGTPVGEAHGRPSAAGTKSSGKKVANSYTDTIPSQLERDDPSVFITYAVEVLNAEGRGAGLSNQVRVPLARTLPPPQSFSAHVTNQGVVLSWTSDLAQTSSADAAHDAVHYVYRVYRRPEGSQQRMLAGEVAAGGDRDLSLTDSNIEWEKTYEYSVETVTVITHENQPQPIEGDDSSEVKVFADDIFPPAIPLGLQAVFSGPGQQPFIDLIWAPVTDVDLDGYNVYRHEEGAAPVKVNAAPVKTPAYRDVSVAAGKNYLYSVSAVDVRGNESSRSEEAGESVP